MSLSPFKPTDNRSAALSQVGFHLQGETCFTGFDAICELFDTCVTRLDSVLICDLAIRATRDVHEQTVHEHGNSMHRNGTSTCATNLAWHICEA